MQNRLSEHAELTAPPNGVATRVGPYWLERRLAVGGTAEVYLARPIDPNGQPPSVIVKRLLPFFVTDPEGRAMFEQEARLQAAVKHENVVTVLDWGVSEAGEPYLALEFVKGVDGYRLLRALARESRRLPIGVAVFVTCKILAALTCVHRTKDAHGSSMGIVHRDITPSNIYFSEDGLVKLGDFGIARAAARATLRLGPSPVIKGKFAYLAPEQVQGLSFDERADLFSTATVLAEMLLGRQLFSGDDPRDVLLAIRDGRLDSLMAAEATLPPPLFETLRKALAHKPSDRFQTAFEFSANLLPHSAREEEAIQVLSAEVLACVAGQP